MTQTAMTEHPQYEILAVKAKNHFIQVLDQKTWDRELTFALQIMRNNAEMFTKIAEQNPQSITNQIINIATIGTTLNPALRQAYLINCGLVGGHAAGCFFATEG